MLQTDRQTNSNSVGVGNDWRQDEGDMQSAVEAMHNGIRKDAGTTAVLGTTWSVGKADGTSVDEAATQKKYILARDLWRKTIPIASANGDGNGSRRKEDNLESFVTAARNTGDFSKQEGFVRSSH